MSMGCKVCDDAATRRAVDEELVSGKTHAYIARLMTLRGFSVTAETIGRHNKHREPDPEWAAAKRPTDLAILLRDRMVEAISGVPVENILDKDLQPAIGNSLKAQAIIDKREVKKVTANFWISLFTGQQGSVPELEDGNTIEGEARDVTDART